MTKNGFSDSELAAMKQRAEELRSTKGLKGAVKLAREFEACVETIDALKGVDREVGSMLHRIVTEEAPGLNPKTWYGFPAYAKDGNVIVFFQPKSKFDVRYPTVGFNEDATLDDGDMWETSFAVIAASASVEKRLRELVRKATK